MYLWLYRVYRSNSIHNIVKVYCKEQPTTYISVHYIYLSTDGAHEDFGYIHINMCVYFRDSFSY